MEVAARRRRHEPRLRLLFLTAQVDFEKKSTTHSCLSQPMDRRAVAFETLFHRHFQWVVHQARLVVGERDAEDVAQEVFLRLYQAQARGDFDSTASPLAWLRTSTYRAARDRQRHLAWQQPVTQDHELNPVDQTLMADPERALAVQQHWAFMWELVDAIEPQRRLVFVMAELDEIPLVEIADILEISPNTVSSRLRLARADFVAALTRKRAEEQRKLRGVGALILPLDAEALLRMTRVLPMPDVSASTWERAWEGVQRKIARLNDPEGIGIVPRLKSEASKLSTFVLGTIVGVLAAAALGDAHAVRPKAREGYPPSESATLQPAVVVPPAVVNSATVAPVVSSSSLPLPAGVSDSDVAETLLVVAAQTALQPPNPDPERTLRLLDEHAHRFPRSRRFMELIARLRQDAQLLATQNRHRR
jgi:RNA polymerase sigma-70 factor, ECF subfamily